MRRIAILTVCLFLLFSVAVTAAPAKNTADDIYVLPTGKISDKVTYHGEQAEPVFERGANDEKAVVLHGTDYLTVDLSEMQAPFTLSAWVNWQGNAADQRIFSLVKADSENYLSVSPFTDTAVVGKAAAGGVTILTSCFKEAFLRENYYNPTIAGVSDALRKHQWHHIAFTVNETDVTLYIDGVCWKTVTLPFTYTELGADTLYIGSASNGTNGFVGMLQAFTMHKTALDATTVAHMAQGIAAEDTESPVTVGKYAAATLPTADMLQQTKEVTLSEKGEATFAAVPTAFWENPQIATGQTVSGTLTIRNKSNNLVNLQLAEIVLPAADTPAYRYLSEIHVTVMQNDTVLYEGPYTALRAEALSWRWQQMPNDRQFMYTIALSRPFSSVAETVDTAVEWKWETAFLPMNQNPLRGVQSTAWLLIALAASAVAVGFSAYWAIVRRPRRMFTVWDAVAEKVLSLFGKTNKTTKQENQDE